MAMPCMQQREGRADRGKLGRAGDDLGQHLLRLPDAVLLVSELDSWMA